VWEEGLCSITLDVRGTVYFCCTVTESGVIAWDREMYRRSFGYGMDGVALLFEDGIDGDEDPGSRTLRFMRCITKVYNIYTPRIPRNCLSCTGNTIIAGCSRCLLVRPVLTVILIDS